MKRKEIEYYRQLYSHWVHDMILDNKKRSEHYQKMLDKPLSEYLLTDMLFKMMTMKPTNYKLLILDNWNYEQDFKIQYKYFEGNYAIFNDIKTIVFR